MSGPAIDAAGGETKERRTPEAASGLGEGTAPGVSSRIGMATPPNQPRVTRSATLGFGAGNMANQIFDSGIQYIVLQVFNMTLGVNPVLVGLAQTVARRVDLITDPLAGYLSDSLRERISLRTYLGVGSAVGGAAFALIWMVPYGWSAHAYFTWLLLWFSTVAIAWSFFSVPRAALGIEMTSDKVERSKLMTISGFMAIACNFCLCWSYAVTQWPIFGGTLGGARWVGGAMGAAIVVLGLVAACFCPVRKPTVAGERGGERRPGWADFAAAIRRVLGCRPFLYLALAFAIIQVGLIAVDMGLLPCIIIYYVAGGSQGRGAVLLGAAATAWLVAAMAVSAPVLWMSLRFGKKPTLLFFLLLTLAGSAMRWRFYNPAAPYWLIIPFALYGCGTGAFFLLAPAMTADTCDWEEARSGQCDSGMFSAVFSWFNKLGTTLGTAVMGWLIAVAGVGRVPHLLGPRTILRMKAIDTIVPTAGVLVGIVLMLLYRINPSRPSSVTSVKNG